MAFAMSRKRRFLSHLSLCVLEALFDGAQRTDHPFGVVRKTARKPTCAGVCPYVRQDVDRSRALNLSSADGAKMQPGNPLPSAGGQAVSGRSQCWDRVDVALSRLEIMVDGRLKRQASACRQAFAEAAEQANVSTTG